MVDRVIVANTTAIPFVLPVTGRRIAANVAVAISPAEWQRETLNPAVAAWKDAGALVATLRAEAVALDRASLEKMTKAEIAAYMADHGAVAAPDVTKKEMIDAALLVGV